MTTISRANYESLVRAMAEGRMAGPQPFKRENDVTKDFVGKGKVVEMTAQEKAMFLQRQAASEAGAAEMAKLEALRQGTGPAAITYTKFGKISTEEEKAAFVQWSLDQFDAAEALIAKRRQEIEKNNTAVSPTGQSDNANTATPPLEKYLYKESREIYLPNISDLSPANARKILGIVESKIENREDAGMNVHGRYGHHDISDLNTYLAGLKDYISKIEVGVSPAASSEPAKGAASTGG